MAEYIDWVFAPDGPLKHLFPGYAPRSGQIAMAQASEKALCEGHHLLVEAPTGTGKTFAYGTPLCCRASTDKSVGVIVTGNITLQEQLLKKDLPLLAKVLPWPFTYCLLKGRNNYLCLDLVEKIQNNQMRARMSDDQEEQLGKILRWAQTTETGDQAELDFMPDSYVWSEVAVSADECKGANCRFAKSGACYGDLAKKAAYKSNIIITNYHYYFGHVLVREETGDDLVLPPHSMVVFDEAHKMVDIARDFFGLRITYGACRRALGKLDKHHQVHTLLTDAARNLFLNLGTYANSPNYKIRLKQAPPYDYKPLHHELLRLAGYYGRAALNARDEDAQAELEAYERRAAKLAANLEDLMTLADPESIYYLEPDGRGFAALCSRQVDVSQRLREQVFDRTRSTVLASATLATSGNFQYLKGELGLDICDELIVDSPFDWAHQALIVVPDNAPDPAATRGKGFEQLVAEALEETVRLAKGRTLALFTSWSSLNLAYDKIKNGPYQVLKQGDMQRQQLIAEFTKDVSSVLLGVASLWEGIDVPGEALTCVFIDKLPFQQMTDPVLDAIKERNEDGWFRQFYLPRAIIALKQGFGRLIRTTSDVGVVVIMDGRLLEKGKGYRHDFWRSLPPASLSHQLADLGHFLDDHAALRACQPAPK